MRTITVEQAISDLVDNDIKTMIDGNREGDNSYINDIMSDGFVGYWKYSDDALVIEYKEIFNEDIVLVD